MLGHDVGDVLAHSALDILGILQALDGGQQGGQMRHFVHARLMGIKGQIRSRVHKIVAQHAHHVLIAHQVDRVDAGILDGNSGITVDDRVLLHQHLAGTGIDDILSRVMAGDTGGNAQLFIELIAAHAHQVIALGIKEQVVQQRARAVLGRGLAGLLPLVDFNQALRLALGAVAALDGGQQTLILAQQTHDISVAAIAQRTQKHSDGQLTGTVNTHPQHIVAVGFIFQPRAAVGDDLGGKKLLARLIHGHGKIGAGRTNQLADNDALRAIDQEGAVLGHQREIAHEHFGFLDFARFLVLQAHKHLQRRGIGQVAFAAAFD